MGKIQWLSAAVLLFCFGPISVFAGDPPKIEPTIAKEPVYKGKPRYCRLEFGPTGSEHVWLVQDGDVLYVDRRGDGDLTGAGCKIASGSKSRRTLEGSFLFEVPDLTVGGRVHKALSVYLRPLKIFADGPFGKRDEVKAALAKDAQTLSAEIYLEAEVPGLKGAGIGGRVRYLAGPIDLTGVFQFGDSPSRAPIVRIGGPLQVTFYFERPTLRVGRSSDMVLVVGTPGVGPGTFAMIGYEDTIPESAKPIAEIAFHSRKPGGAPVIEKFEIKDRC